MSRQCRLPVAAALACAVLAAAAADADAQSARGDFNADGHKDLAIGAPNDTVQGRPGAGAVNTLDGARGGLTAHGDEQFTTAPLGIDSVPKRDAHLGAALAAGDLNREGVDGQAGAGAVHVLYGRPDALRTPGAGFFTQNTPGVKGVAGPGNRFGAALAAGDLSRNGRAELAIGLPGAGARSGAALVLYGRAGGLGTADDLWSQDARGIKGVAAANDRFGQALAIADFDADGAGDLAVGVPNEPVGGARDAGAVNVIRGSGRGLHAGGDRRFSQDTPGIKGRASTGETFGTALAAGDFSHNGADDLAIGVPGEQVAGEMNAGAVSVLYGARGRGLRERADQLVSQDSAGVKGRAEQEDRLGDAIGTGDFDDDGVWDLAIGVPGDTVGVYADGGAVQAIHGTDGGLRARGDERWTQGTSGVKGGVGDDRFGAALAAG